MPVDAAPEEKGIVLAMMDRRTAKVAAGAVVLVAVALIVASLLQTPTYEASAEVLVGLQHGNRQGNPPARGEAVVLTEGPDEWVVPLIGVIDSRPVAEETVRSLGSAASPGEVLDNVTVEQVWGTSSIRITYRGTDPEAAERIANAFAAVSSERISEMSVGGSNFTAAVREKATVPDAPAPPEALRKVLLALVIALALSAVLARALPGPLAASVAVELGGRIRRVRRRVGEARVPAAAPISSSVAEGIKERELLEALGRRGKLTAAGAALETSLRGEEADWMLRQLAAEGRLEVSVEDGRQMYALWECDRPQ
ncbi:hypothetical protein GBA63_18555 [Rubrobacter tropicus]|uniref:Polysaccharide chain length determinant N-terminal domain-containing protein n=1 Tax=Rubrobacter tropicus TaxID=2653851 RepID=A0A6G8QDA4_9ACTN|nr:hypothetical protein [Rubrobacter tropicus]QIN84418.1 hypothetical protein GBA63_18555 [Rubrobacter tropicus]